MRFSSAGYSTAEPDCSAVQSHRVRLIANKPQGPLHHSGTNHAAATVAETVAIEEIAECRSQRAAHKVLPTAPGHRRRTNAVHIAPNIRD
jgi:hypothetical protein